MTKPGDIDHFTRVRTYKALARKYYHPDRIVLALLPLAMRLAGPREALWHALIRRNYGANHMIIGRDHASPGNDSTGKPFYGRTPRRNWCRALRDEVGVKAVAVRRVCLFAGGRSIRRRKQDRRRMLSTAQLSGTLIREWYRDGGAELPAWFARPEVTCSDRERLSAASQARVLHLVHRVKRCGKINDRGNSDRVAAGVWTTGDAARRRRRSE